MQYAKAEVFFASQSQFPSKTRITKSYRVVLTELREELKAVEGLTTPPLTPPERPVKKIVTDYTEFQRQTKDDHEKEGKVFKSHFDGYREGLEAKLRPVFKELLENVSAKMDDTKRALSPIW